MMREKIRRHRRNGTLVQATRARTRALIGGRVAIRNRFDGTRAERYEEKRQVTEEWQSEQQIAIDYLRSLDDGLSVLDVPFGTGRFLEDFLAKGYTVTGLDASTDMIDSARRLRGDAIDQCTIDIGDARSLPYADETFDLVVCFRFLILIVSSGDARKVLRELHRVSRRFAILDLGYRDPELPPRRMPVRDRDKWSYELQPEEIVDELRSIGFEVLRQERAYKTPTGYRSIYLCEKIAPSSPTSG